MELRHKIVRCEVCGFYYDSLESGSCPYCSGTAVPAVEFAPIPDDISEQLGHQKLYGPPFVIPNSYKPPVQQIVRCETCSYYFDKALNDRCPYCSDYAVLYGPPLIDRTPPAPLYGPPLIDRTPTDRKPAGAELEIISGEAAGTVYTLFEGFNHIGSEYGDIVIPHDRAIRREQDSTVACNDSGFFLCHDRGKNVLRVNGEPVLPGNRQLNDGDTLTIGSTQLVFRITSAPGSDRKK